MRTTFNPASEDLAPYQIGPLAVHVPDYADLLGHYGYAVAHGRTKLCQVRDFSQWLGKKRIGVEAVNEQVIEAFRSGRRKLSRCIGEGATLSLLLRHLRDVNVVPPPCHIMPESSVERVVREYCEHQVNERCLGKLLIRPANTFISYSVA